MHGWVKLCYPSWLKRQLDEWLESKNIPTQDNSEKSEDIIILRLAVPSTLLFCGAFPTGSWMSFNVPAI